MALAMGRAAVATRATHKRIRRGNMHTALGARDHLKGLLLTAARRGLLTGLFVAVGAPLPDDEQSYQKQQEVLQAARPNTTSSTKREPT